MKQLDLGFTTVLNEEECLTAWIKQALYFCKRVVVLIDPTTTDASFRIVDRFKDLGFPVSWQHQDRSLGDSDRERSGLHNIAIWHANQNKMIRSIPNGQWYMFCDTDEIMMPEQWSLILRTINIYRESNYQTDGILQEKIEFYPDDHRIINWKTIGLNSVLHCVFHKKTEHQQRGLDPHGSITYPTVPRVLGYPIYHYTNLKSNAKRKWYDAIPSSDLNRMIRQFGEIQTIPFENPIPDWRTLESVL